MSATSARRLVEVDALVGGVVEAGAARRWRRDDRRRRRTAARVPIDDIALLQAQDGRDGLQIVGDAMPQFAPTGSPSARVRRSAARTSSSTCTTTGISSDSTRSPATRFAPSGRRGFGQEEEPGRQVDRITTSRPAGKRADQRRKPARLARRLRKAAAFSRGA